MAYNMEAGILKCVVMKFWHKAYPIAIIATIHRTWTRYDSVTSSNVFCKKIYASTGKMCGTIHAQKQKGTSEKVSKVNNKSCSQFD